MATMFWSLHCYSAISCQVSANMFFPSTILRSLSFNRGTARKSRKSNRKSIICTFLINPEYFDLKSNVKLLILRNFKFICIAGW